MSLTRAPLVPAALLRQHDCFIAGDTRFRAAARLRQSIWREEQGLPAGLHRPGGRRDVPAIPLGSLLTPADAARGRNFIDARVHAFVRRSLALAEDGASIQTERLMRNALSSEPLNYNAFGPLALDLDLATAVLRRVLPAFVHRVEAVRFETAPSRDRADPRFLMDGSAHDTAFLVITPDGEPATLFVEVKYSEGSGPAAAWRPRYDAAIRETALHRDPDAKVLRSVAAEQFTRLHLLAQLCVKHGLTPRAHLLVLHPQANRRVALATRLYADELVDPAGANPGSVGVTALTLEAFVDALHQAGAGTQAAYLHHRYLDLTAVLDLVLRNGEFAPDDPPAPPAPPTIGPVAALPPPPATTDAAEPVTAIDPVPAVTPPPARTPRSRVRRRVAATPASPARARARGTRRTHPAAASARSATAAPSAAKRRRA